VTPGTVQVGTEQFVENLTQTSRQYRDGQKLFAVGGNDVIDEAHFKKHGFTRPYYYKSPKCPDGMVVSDRKKYRKLRVDQVTDKLGQGYELRYNDSRTQKIYVGELGQFNEYFNTAGKFFGSPLI